VTCIPNFRKGSKFPRLPSLKKLSKPQTSCPSPTKAFASVEPVKPQIPVMKIFILVPRFLSFEMVNFVSFSVSF